MIKKVLVILVFVSLAVTLLAGCSNEPPEGSVAETPPSSTNLPSDESGTPTPSEPDTPTPSEPDTPSTLTMLSITEGEVFIIREGVAGFVEAEVGMTLEVGDIIKSGAGSSAEITFFDGSTIELQANTQIEVASLDIATDTGSTTIRVLQEIGNTVSRLEKLSDSASSYEVETPAGVAAVRGSSMLVQVISDGTTWVTNLEGEIWVTANGVELQIPEGMKCIIRIGWPPRLISLGDSGGGFYPNPDIEITKTPDLMEAHEGDTITYTYTVTNPGNVPLSAVSVTDDKIADVTYQSGDTDVDGILDVGETWVFTATYTVTADDEDPLVNNAAAAGTDALFQTIIAWTTASVTVTAVNDPPDAVEDSATTPEDTPVTIDVLANDTDVEGDTLTVDSVTQGANGSVINNGSDVTYTPDPDFFGTDNFTYTVSDGNGGTDTATVTVTVTAVTDYANINVQIDTAMGASIHLWDDTEGDWAIDEDTGNPINGENHTTPSNITVAADHCYYVWVEKDGYIFHVKNYPDGWSITPAPFGANEAAYGCAAANSQYQVHFTGTEISEPVIVRFPEEGTAYIGYEDTESGDFDYNDFGMNMFIEEVYVDDCLTEINMEFESVTKQSGGSHDIHILRELSEGTAYNYTLTRSTTAQGTETPAMTNAPGQGYLDIVLFDSSYFTSGDTVTIHIEVTSGCEPYGSEVPPPRWDLDSIWVHYDPYMDYRSMSTERHIGDWQSADPPLPTTGYNVPYILVVPMTDWSPPAEGQAITVQYPDFDDYYSTGSPENWYEQE